MALPGPKYELVAQPSVEGEPQRFRVKALRDIYPADQPMVHKGTMGGYVDGAQNLAQEGECWIADDAMSGEDSTVSEDSSMRDRATLLGKAHLMHHAQMSDESCAMGASAIYGKARVSGKSLLSGSARVGGESRVHDSQITRGLVEDAGIIALDKDLDYVFDSSKLAADQQAGGATAPCGAPTASGEPCSHMVRPSTTYCPSGHWPHRRT